VGGVREGHAVNLFVTGWNCGEEGKARATQALRAMHETFPLLEPATCGTWDAGHAFAAWMHVSDEAAGPRRYVHRTPHELVLFDGTAVDPRGRIAGHDAASLASHWPEATDHLEGRFAVVRLDERADTLEVINDPFGLHPTFVQQSGDAWWIANSVRLLVGVAGRASIDQLGMARCIVMRWPGEDRTLVEGVAALPAGQRWLWSRDGPVQRSTYAPAGKLAPRQRRSFGAREAAELARAMGGMLEALSASFEPLECPLTAGRDSRVLAGLMLARGLRGDYFTLGEPWDLDVTIGTAVAGRLGLPHRRVGTTVEHLAAAWDRLSRRIVQQHDGMATVAHARNAFVRPERLERVVVQLYGAGGERGRGLRFTEGFVLHSPSPAEAIAQTVRSFCRASTLVRPEVVVWVREHIERSCRGLLEEGFEPLDIPDAFATAEYGRRWGGSQARQIVDHKDVVLPFYTRAFMRAAFATPARERFMERVPFELLKYLSPELQRLPFGVPWPPQHLALLLARRAAARPDQFVQRVKGRLTRGRVEPSDRIHDRLVVLERNRSSWRERYLDQSDSSVWQVIDRDRLAHLLSDRATPAQRKSQQRLVFQILTGLIYEEDLRAWTGASAARSPRGHVAPVTAPGSALPPPSGA
jgi:asparagine synthase (glutamine-hydrolysing)